MWHLTLMDILILPITPFLPKHALRYLTPDMLMRKDPI